MNHELSLTDHNITEKDEFSIENHLKLQNKLLELLAQRTARYTAGDSSSIPKETAQELLNSICFTLGIDLNSRPSLLMELLHADLDARYESGILEIESKLERGKALWQAVCSVSRIKNISLEDTLKNIEHFWKRYDYRFFAHTIPCDIDYQLCHPVPETMQGVDYVNEFLQRLLMEQDFLRRFDPKLSIKLLEQYCGDYQGLLINLYEPIATNAIGLAMVGSNIVKLNLSEKEQEEIVLILKPLTKDNIMMRLLDAAQIVCQSLHLHQNDAKRYLMQLSEQLYPRISSALLHENLSGIFLSFN
jgi:hypothetical protein